MGDRLEHLTALLSEVLTITGELARCEDDPGIEVAALTRECRERFAEVLKIMPVCMDGGMIKDEDGSAATNDVRSIENTLRLLHLKTQQCIEVLTRCRDHTEEEMFALRQARKAVKAYTTMPDSSRLR